MADQLCTPEDLAALLQLDWAALSEAEQARLTLLVEAATAVVQAAAGQRIVLVEDDQIELMGTTDSWLDLPQRPVSVVSAVSVDGSPLTVDAYRRFGGRLWRGCGWASCSTAPSVVSLTYTHGYPPGDQGLELARSAALGLAAGVAGSPAGVTREQIDDYSVAYDAAASLMDGSPTLRGSLRRAYGRRAGLVRVG